MAIPFIETFVKHMDDATHLNVSLATDSQELKDSSIYIASQKSVVSRKGSGYFFNVSEGKAHDYNPNINELFISCADFSSKINVLAIVLTGIGDDGAKGMKKLCDTQSICITENEASAVVYGMPQRAQEMCERVEVEPLDEIVERIKKFGA